jgi:hypothetical protein
LVIGSSLPHAEDRSQPSQRSRCVLGPDAGRYAATALTSCEKTGLWDERRPALRGPSRACDWCDGRRRTGPRLAGRTHGRTEQRRTSNGWEARRTWAGAAGESSSASAWQAWAGPLRLETLSWKPSPNPERRSPPSMLCAWARRNSDQLGPMRRGAGPRPDLRNTLAIVVAETLIPSFSSSPWMRI